MPALIEPFGSLPEPPVQTHREERGALPVFSVGPPGDRLPRAQAYLADCRARIEARHRAGVAGLSVCRLTSEAQDRLVVGLFEEMARERAAPTSLALVALGSYGRRELAPHSDLDLLLLLGRAAHAEVQTFARDFHTLLWDLKIQVGWSVRTPAECARAAEEDHTVRTALLDCRRLTGDEAVYAALAEGIREMLSHKADEFIRDKTLELEGRRQKYGDSLYLLEPQVKQGEGGLRDLEAALWIAQARFRTRGLTQLLQQSILPGSEVAALKAARDFLLRVRNHLHYVRGRKEDRLTFDLQEEVAAFLGYQASDEGLPVEGFMRHYYLSAKAIRLAADDLIARCEERSKARRYIPERRLGAFKVFRGKLTLEEDAAALRERPELVLRLFRTADEAGLPLYSWAQDQVREALPALAESRGRPEVTAELKALFARTGSRGQFLFPLHELGVLGAVLPEFGRITAHHQHDLYHVYTVDVHSLFALRRLYALRAGEGVAEVPELSRQMREIENPLPLYLGMLLHDCGKGLGGNHSEKGRALAAEVAVRLGLSHRQREVLEFLVLEHLSMSHTAQRRDLSDPHLIAAFAQTCGDVEKLSCLYLLTYADITSVGPKMWTEWKAQLLEELFRKTRAELLGESGAAEGPLVRARAEFRKRWDAALGPKGSEQLGASLPDRYFLSTDPRHAARHARLIAGARKSPLTASLLHCRAAGTSELTLAAPDRPGLLALFAGVLSAHRIDILGARIASTADGIALDAFDVRAPHGRLLERDRWRAARGDLLRVLAGEASVEAIIRKRRSTSLSARPLPKVTAKVSVDNRASQRFTVVDLRAEDRVGLLYAVADALHSFGAEIALARVATEAHRAIDSFYVTQGGRKIDAPADGERLVAHLQDALVAFERDAKGLA